MNYFLNMFAPAIKPTVLQEKFTAFGTDYNHDYLMKNYFAESATVNPTYWSYFSDINIIPEFNTTTNNSETIDEQLKILCDTIGSF